MNIIMAAILAAPFLAGGDEQDHEAKNAVAEFTSTYNRKTATDEERISAIRRLAGTPHKRTGLVLQKLIRSHNARVPVSHKMEAAFGLAGFSSVKGASLLAANGLISRNNRKNTQLRVTLVQTIGSLRQKHLKTLQVLHKLALGDDFEVARAAIVVIPIFDNRGSVKMLIDYLRKCERVPANVKVGLKIPRQPRRPNPEGVDPTEDRRDIGLKFTADEKQRQRHELCYPAIKTALRTMTGQYFPDWKAWNQWWRKGGAFKEDVR